MSGVPCSTRLVAVIEDDPAVRDSIRLLLDLGGIASLGYASAEDWLADGRRFDCLVVDDGLPGLSGRALLRGRAGGQPPAILLDGRPGRAGTRLQGTGGASGVLLLEKPFDPSLLLQLVRDRVAAGHT